MTQPTDEQNARPATVNRSTESPRRIPLVTRLGKKIARKPKNEPKVTEYERDWFEESSRGERVVLVGLPFVVLTLVIFGNGGFDLQTLTIYVTSILSLCLITVAMAQYYVYKRQAYAMRLQEARMTEQRDVMTDTLKHLRAMEQPLVMIKKAECFPPIAPDLKLVPRLTVANFGRATATHIWLSCRFRTVKAKIIDCPDDFPDLFGLVRMVEPRKRAKRWMIKSALTLTEDEITQIFNDEVLLAIYGTARVFDAGKQYQELDPFIFYFAPTLNKFVQDIDTPLMETWNIVHRVRREAKKKARADEQDGENAKEM